jgi:excisionase family DNA binding protein
MTEQSPDAAHTVAQVATRFNVTDQTVRDWIARGRLRAARPGGKAWIILESDIQTMLGAGDPGFAPERAGRQLWRAVAPALDEAEEEPPAAAEPTDLWDGADEGVRMTSEQPEGGLPPIGTLGR